LNGDPIQFMAAAALAAAAAAFTANTVRELLTWTGIGADTTSVLFVISCFAALFVIASARAERGVEEDEPDDGANHDPTMFLHGVVKRFSDRNGWGLISVPVAGLPRSGKTPQRQDVRFYRPDKDLLGLKVGDQVVLRAVADPQASGWLRAMDIRRPTPEDLAEDSPVKELCYHSITELTAASRPTRPAGGATVSSGPRQHSSKGKGKGGSGAGRRQAHSNSDSTNSNQKNNEDRCTSVVLNNLLRGRERGSALMCGLLPGIHTGTAQSRPGAATPVVGSSGSEADSQQVPAAEGANDDQISAEAGHASTPDAIERIVEESAQLPAGEEAATGVLTHNDSEHDDDDDDARGSLDRSNEHLLEES